MTSLHIYAPPVDDVGVQTLECPTCGVERGFLLQHWDWHGWYLTCLWCGERWGDGERLERPFRRGWRAQSVSEALRALETALRAV